MGTLIGLLLGVGLLLAWSATWPPTASPAPSGLRQAWGDLANQAGLHAVSLEAFALASAAGSLIVGIFAFTFGSALTVSCAFAVIAGAVPLTYVSMRARRRRVELRSLWPDVVDDLTSAVRAGLTLPEAMITMSERGPVQLREDLAVFAAEYRASGRFIDALDAWQVRLADPVADRLVATLRIASDVGGTDLGKMLRTLSEFLRTDLRTRSELEARQSWTVNGARLAIAAPWLVLALMSGRGSTAAAFDTPAGVVVLVIGAVVSVVAYLAMMRIGRLPEEPRVLRGIA